MMVSVVDKFMMMMMEVKHADADVNGRMLARSLYVVRASLRVRQTTLAAAAAHNNKYRGIAARLRVQCSLLMANCSDPMLQETADKYQEPTHVRVWWDVAAKSLIL